MPPIGRIDPFIAGAAARLRAESAQIRAATGHRGEAGRARESALSDVLQELLPRRIAVRTGAVLGIGGLSSSQLDIVLCDVENYPEFGYESNASLLLPDAIYAVISVRTRLRPTDVHDHFEEARALKRLINDALGYEWAGYYAVVAYELEGAGAALIDQFHEEVFAGPKRGGVDLIASVDRGPICFDLASFGNAGNPPSFLAGRAHIPGIAFDACHVDTDEPFVDAYKLMLLGLDRMRLTRVIEMAAPPPGEALAEGLSTDPRFQAAFAGKSADLDLAPGQAGLFVMFYANVGTETWIRGTPTEVSLKVAGPTGHTTPAGWDATWAAADVYCQQTQPAVQPGELATFSFQVDAPMDAQPGHYRFFARPAVADVGALTPETRANAVSIAGPTSSQAEGTDRGKTR